MGTRPYTQLWLGTKAGYLEDLLLYPGADREYEDPYDWNEENKGKMGVEVVDVLGGIGGLKYALALECYSTGWTDGLELNLRSSKITAEETERMQAAAKMLSWKLEGPITWWLAAAFA
jgi:hypothetical protein